MSAATYVRACVDVGFRTEPAVDVVVPFVCVAVCCVLCGCRRAADPFCGVGNVCVARPAILVVPVGAPVVVPAAGFCWLLLAVVAAVVDVLVAAVVDGVYGGC